MVPRFIKRSQLELVKGVFPTVCERLGKRGELLGISHYSRIWYNTIIDGTLKSFRTVAFPRRAGHNMNKYTVLIGYI